MSDRFHPISMAQLTDWVFTELERRDSIFNVPRRAFFVPRPEHRFAGPRGERLEGIGAGQGLDLRVVESEALVLRCTVREV